jgi:hypothetical protein
MIKGEIEMMAISMVGFKDNLVKPFALLPNQLRKEWRMIIKNVWLLLLVFVLILGCQQNDKFAFQKDYPQKIEVSLTNISSDQRIDELITLGIEKLLAKNDSFNKKAFIVIEGEKEIPAQLSNNNIVFTIGFGANESKKIEVRFSEQSKKTKQYPARAYAELSYRTGGKFEGQKYIGGAFSNFSSLKLPDEHVLHDDFIRYEGPGWESDKVGFRYYLDNRNAIDVFGKKTSEMSLQHINQDTSGSYHEMQFWGMDVFQVGNSLGIGSIGYWNGKKTEMVSKVDSIFCSIPDNGPIVASVSTKYSGWDTGTNKMNLQSNLSISAGKRYSRHDLLVDESTDNLCTGIIKNKNSEIIKSNRTSGWQYFAMYGKQSLAGDKLGTAIFYNSDQLREITEDEHSHVIVLTTIENGLTYYFAAAWEQEKDGLKTQDEFVTWLDSELEKFNNPIQISF